MNDGVQISHLDFHALIGREWLVANGIGGYSSSTIAALNTRKYHGLLVAAMTPPVRRMVLLSHIVETLTAESKRFSICCAEYPGAIHPSGHLYLRAFQSVPLSKVGVSDAGGDH